VSGLPINLGPETILGCSNPCPASLDLTQTSATAVDGTLTVGNRSFSGTFALETVTGGMVITSSPVQVHFDLPIQSPLGTIVISTTCTVDPSGGVDLDPSPAGLAATGCLPVTCSGTGGGFTVGANGSVALSLVRGG
jgi:hypothetical protein